jgi:hypothetical protein
MGYVAPKAPYPAKFRTDLVGTLSERRIRQQYQKRGRTRSLNRPPRSYAPDVYKQLLKGWLQAGLARTRLRPSRLA